MLAGLSRRAWEPRSGEGWLGRSGRHETLVSSRFRVWDYFSAPCSRASSCDDAAPGVRINWSQFGPTFRKRAPDKESKNDPTGIRNHKPMVMQPSDGTRQIVTKPLGRWCFPSTHRGHEWMPCGRTGTLGSGNTSGNRMTALPPRPGLEGSGAQVALVAHPSEESDRIRGDHRGAGWLLAAEACPARVAPAIPTIGKVDLPAMPLTMADPCHSLSSTVTRVHNSCRAPSAHLGVQRHIARALAVT